MPPAASAATSAARRAPQPCATWRRWAGLGVPALVMAGVALSVLAIAGFDSHASLECHEKGSTLRMHMAGWAGLACGVAAPVLYAVLRRAAWRRGQDPDRPRATGFALAFVVFNTLALILELFVIWMMYAPDPSGGHACSALAYAFPFF